MAPSSGRGCGDLEFGGTFGQQCLRLERPLTGIVTLHYHLDASAKNIGDDASIDDGERFRSLSNHKFDGLRLNVVDNRTRLHDTRHAHRLPAAGTRRAAMQFGHSHIVDSASLGVRVDKIDDRPQNSQPAQNKAQGEPFAPSAKTA